MGQNPALFLRPRSLGVSIHRTGLSSGLFFEIFIILSVSIFRSHGTQRGKGVKLQCQNI